MLHKNNKNYRFQPLLFPKNFLWGASTSAHQVEGENINNDWWEFEQQRIPKLRSGKACDQWNLYKEDIALIKKLGHQAHRLSLEWSRIEPSKGEWSQEAIDHYKNVLKELKKNDIKVCLTIHHFTNPKWLGAEAWEKSSTAILFERFAKKCAEEFGEYVDFWITINEPSVFMYQGWHVGVWPPGKKVSQWKQLHVLWIMAKAHKKAYQAIKKYSQAPIGIANNVQSYQAYDRESLKSLFQTWLLEFSNNRLFYLLSGKNTHDFLGMNYYFHHRLVKSSGVIPNFLDPIHEKRERNDLGWEVHPEGLFQVIMSLNHYQKPMMITECGIATESEHVRQRHMMKVLKEVSHAIGAGANMIGFMYWSFMDNFEWADGFTPRFGLVEIDYKTQKRIPRNSAWLYKKIIQENQIHQDLFQYFGYQTEFDPKTNKVK